MSVMFDPETTVSTGEPVWKPAGLSWTIMTYIASEPAQWSGGALEREFAAQSPEEVQTAIGYLVNRGLIRGATRGRFAPTPSGAMLYEQHFKRRTTAGRTHRAQVLACVYRRGEATSTEVAAELKLHQVTAGQHLRALVRDGNILKIGTFGRGTRYARKP